MKKAIVQFAASSIHFAASLEILHNESQRGNSLHYCLWSGRTKFPGRMSVDFARARGVPPRWAERLIHLADPSVVYSTEMKFDEKWVKALLAIFKVQTKDITAISEISQIHLEGIQPGPAIINELTTITKNSDFDPKQNLRLMALLCESYLQVFQATVNLIKDKEITELHLFNGRFLHERAVWDAAKSLEISVILFETTRNRYFQRREGFHNRVNNQRVMIDHWDKSIHSKEEKIRIGSEYFAELRGKTNPFFTKHESSIAVTKPFFVYFSSSDDEMAGLWDENPASLGGQISSVRKLQHFFDLQTEYQLVIRKHPNLLNKSEEQQLTWAGIKETHSTRICEPDQDVSSYKLLDDCVGSITFGSTLGLESAFVFKPSLVLTDCGYDLLGVVDKAESWEEVSHWIKENHKLTSSQLLERRSNACIRGYFLATGGQTFERTTLVERGWGSWDALAFENRKFPVRSVLNLYPKTVSRMKLFRALRHLNHG